MKVPVAMLSALSLMQAVACAGGREPGTDAIASEPPTALAGFGFSWGVILMLGVSLSIVGSLVTYIWRRIVALDSE